MDQGRVKARSPRGTAGFLGSHTKGELLLGSHVLLARGKSLASGTSHPHLSTLTQALITFKATSKCREAVKLASA